MIDPHRRARTIAIAAALVGLFIATAIIIYVRVDSVIAAQESAYQACIAAGRADCHLNFSMSALVTPQLLAALVALGVVALIPVVVRKWRARRGAAMPG